MRTVLKTAVDAIEQVFSDLSVAPEITRADLLELGDRIEIYIDTIDFYRGQNENDKQNKET